MKKIILFLFIGFLFISCKKTKKSTKYIIVNDAAHFFSTEEKQALTAKILNYEKQTTREIGIVTQQKIPKGEKALNYATQLANTIGIGKKESNNGLLIFITKKDRKISIATGLCTEKTLTDSICNRIINKVIVPQFKQGYFYKGINNTLDTIFLKWK